MEADSRGIQQLLSGLPLNQILRITMESEPGEGQRQDTAVADLGPLAGLVRSAIELSKVRALVCLKSVTVISP